MLLLHALQTRLIRGAGGVLAPPVAVPDLIGRRRRTRTYKAPTPEALRDEYESLRDHVPDEVLRPLIGPYLLKGDFIHAPPASSVDWSALIQNTEAVIKLVDAYLEYVEEEDIAVILLGA